MAVLHRPQIFHRAEVQILYEYDADVHLVFEYFLIRQKTFEFGRVPSSIAADCGRPIVSLMQDSFLGLPLVDRQHGVGGILRHKIEA